MCDYDTTSRVKYLAKNRGNSVLTQMIQDVNDNHTDANKILKEKGYGYLPLKSVFNNPEMLKSSTKGESFQIKCEYNGYRYNLYGNGTA